MGNYLAETVLGSGFSAEGLRIPGKFGENTAFAFEESTSGLLLKCWVRSHSESISFLTPHLHHSSPHLLLLWLLEHSGPKRLWTVRTWCDPQERVCGAICFEWNDVASLLVTDRPTHSLTHCHSDGGNEMGDYLAFTDLGFTMSPTAEPTASPTVDPTAGPTSDPTMEPTTNPTIDPTPAPTRCMAKKQKQVDWYSLYHSSGDQGDEFLKEYSVDFDDETYSVTLSATVEYVGKSTDGHLDDSFNLGTTYWIDLQSFSESAGGIDDAGSCGNRRSADYDGLSFADWWSMTVDPEDLDSAPTADRMAYPPSSWTFSSTDCQTVKYERTFSLAVWCRDCVF